MKITKETLKKVIKEEYDRMQSEAEEKKPLQLYWVKRKEKDGSVSKSYVAVVDSEQDMVRGLRSGAIWHGFRPIEDHVAVPMTPEEQEKFMAPDYSEAAAMYGVSGNTPYKDYGGDYRRRQGSLGS